MRNAFASIVQARPCPTFGRPVHHGVAPSITARYFSSCPSDSTSRWTPCPPVVFATEHKGLGASPWLYPSFPTSCPFRVLLIFMLPGQRGVTPAFGYGAPHPGARGTLTLLISALPSAHYGEIRLPSSCILGVRLLAFPARTGHASPAAKPEISRFPCQRVSTHARVFDCAGSSGCSH